MPACAIQLKRPPNSWAHPVLPTSACTGTLTALVAGGVGDAADVALLAAAPVAPSAFAAAPESADALPEAPLCASEP